MLLPALIPPVLNGARTNTEEALAAGREEKTSFRDIEGEEVF